MLPQNIDPLIMRQRIRPLFMKNLLRDLTSRWAFNAASKDDWSPEFSRRRAKAATGLMVHRFPEIADAAILEMITIEARKRGWRVSRRRGSDSLYVMPNGDDMGRVRVSNHTLPYTHTRQLREERGVGGQWVGEIITKELYSKSKTEIMAEIETEAGQ